MDSTLANCVSCNRTMAVLASFKGKKPRCFDCRQSTHPAVIKAAVAKAAAANAPVTKGAQSLVPGRNLSVKERIRILSCAYETAKRAADNQGVTVLKFLESLFPFPDNDEVPTAIPARLHPEWVYSLDRSWGRAFRGVLLLLIYDGRVNQVSNNDILAGEGFFAGAWESPLHRWRISNGFFEK